MAAITRTVDVPAGADEAWALVGRFEDPTALAPGFAVASRMEESDRVVTFADGDSVREALVSCDADERRLSYTAVGGRSRHHHAVMTVVPLDDRSSRIEWTTYILPDAFGKFVGRRMDQGVAAIARAFPT